MDKKIKEYIDWKGTYASRAAVNYRKWLYYFVEVNGDKKIEKYDIPDLVKFKNWLEDNYSTYSVQFGMVVLHNFFKYWKLKGEKCLSPELIRVKRSYARSHRAITEEEFNLIHSQIPEHTFIGLRDRLILSMLWDTGVRISELCSLNVEQLDRNRHTTVIKNAKNAQSRIIMWSPTTHDLLYAYLPLRAIITNTSPLLISKCMQGIGRLTARSIQRMIQYYTRKAGLYEKITPHSYRHGWAHHRLDQAASIPFIQRGLGHQSPMSTHVYLQYNDKEFEKQAKRYL